MHSPKKRTPEKPRYPRFYDAAVRGDIDTVKKQIDLEANVNWANSNFFGNTPLIAASRDGRANVVETLIAHKADVNKANYNGYTPLHLSAENGNEDIVLLLLKNGADINIKNEFGKTAGQMARENHFPDIAKKIEKWPTLYAIAAMDNYSLNQVDNETIRDLYQYMGGKRKTRGKRILGRKTRSNHRRRN
jgi:ankyrin repeat protein